MPSPLIIGTNGYVAALDPDTGAEIWRTKLQGGVFNATTSQDVSVIVCEGKVFAGAQGHLICLDLAGGRILWRNELKGLGYNDVSLALEGVSIQYLKRVVRSSSGTSASS
jgi:outer membrane protein assembly factor BamB